MPGGASPVGAEYSKIVGACFTFNLIVGCGALALPDAFSQAGYVGGSVLLAVLAFFSAVTSTFMVEAMSLANAITKKRRLREFEAPAARLFDITDTRSAEMASLAAEFFSPLGEKLFYICFIVYLYGDLCIYAVAVPKSIQAVFCSNPTEAPAPTAGGAGNHTTFGLARASSYVPVSPAGTCVFGLTHAGSYHVFLTAFVVLIGPFAYGNITKTQYLQIFTTVMRYATFLLLIALCVAGINNPKPFVHPIVDDHPPALGDLKTFSFSGLTNMFGVSVYSFMCQHSLPSLISPIKDQANVSVMLFAVLGVVAVFYYAVIYSAIMRFPPAVLTDPSHDVYTLVFADYPNRVVSIFLQAFPVFVLSANFPIISITLRNNLIMLGNKFADSAKDPGGGAQHSTGAGGVWAGLGRRGGAACGGAWVRHADVLYPTLAIGPPIVVAYFTEDVEVLISYTGSYAGVGIQYIIPACACYYGRVLARKELGDAAVATNTHRSFFASDVWMGLTAAWTCICYVLVTYNHLHGDGDGDGDGDDEGAAIAATAAPPRQQLHHGRAHYQEGRVRVRHAALQHDHGGVLGVAGFIAVFVVLGAVSYQGGLFGTGGRARRTTSLAG